MILAFSLFTACGGNEANMEISLSLDKSVLVVGDEAYGATTVAVKDSEGETVAAELSVSGDAPLL